MKILKPGSARKVTKVKRFKCRDCGCEFEANFGEYNTLSIVMMVHDGIYAYCDCPFCGETVYCHE